ncbi:KpsF/GutQ family sugar-phosphate isomerase [Bacteroidales bacterium OttesenSCG-928-E04]|nr:KpsF/GutQ family sugar-phosphate isomerase [Bacteroidales bacterium OttesenSCG-928-E04]MDL2326625.1 KpsF/GutQ family sugar-phosphate isomerase [Bacteroidales bacterium OttesenSCG-928-A14]
MRKKIKSKDIISIACNVLQEEADALVRLKSFVDEQFVDAVEAILTCKGRVIITGIGKSAIIAQKIVATFNSTGTPAIFMHAADAIHGDLGIIQPDDIVVCLSKSGNTPEISVLIPILKRSGNLLIAIAGNEDSYLANEADCFLNCSVEREACPNNLAPTSSSTAQLAIGDALAACLIEAREFTSQDFAKYHPGGVLGKRLYLTVSQLYANNDKPQVKPTASIQEVILEISGKRLGVTAVTDEDNRLLGAITDGDLRRMLQQNQEYAMLLAGDIMTVNPKSASSDLLAVEALDIMKKSSITNLFITDKNGAYLGVVHMHDILREGIY